MARRTRYRPARTVLSRQQIDALCEAVALGLPFKHACWVTRTPPSSFFLWMKNARELEDARISGKKLRLSRAEKLWVELYYRVNEARASVFRRNLAVIQVAAQNPNHWTAAAWICERLDPEQFGRQRLSVDVSASDNTDVKTPAQLVEEMMRRTVGEVPSDDAEDASTSQGELRPAE